VKGNIVDEFKTTDPTFIRIYREAVASMSLLFSVVVGGAFVANWYSPTMVLRTSFHAASSAFSYFASFYH